ncbi:MAG: ABC transporter substrate-binding protein [Anaerolineae bacterium]|nr:ABC transporter substrate-binding protein [Anaerolineae bacterium]
MLLVGGGLAAQEEKVLVIGHAEQTDSYDPAHGFTPTTGMVHRATYDTLVTFPDADASAILPSLATDWTISDDGTVYTFTLDTSATFTNGDTLTADDVVFSYMRLQNVKGNPGFLAGPDRIASVEAVDEKTVAITLPAARPSFLVELTNPVFSITNADVVQANGGTDAADAAETDTARDYMDQHTEGTGPYMLESWAPQDETVLVRNPNYMGDAPYFDRVIIVNIPEAATQKAALESGQIDIALDLSPDQIVELEGNADLHIFNGPGQWTHFLLMNADPEIGGPVSDPNVQLAIRYALDYEGYRTLWPGSVTPGTNMAYILAGAYQQDKAFTRDLDKAKELLTEAGYPDGLELTLSYPDFTAPGVVMSTNAQKIQADLAEAGINVTLNPGELQVSLEEYRNGQQAFGYWFWGPDVLDPIDLLSFAPGGKVAAERANWTTDMVDPSIAELVEQAKVESDPAVRTELFNQLQDFMQQSSPFAPFMVPPTQRAYRANILGYVWHPQWELDVALLSRAE